MANNPKLAWRAWKSTEHGYHKLQIEMFTHSLITFRGPTPVPMFESSTLDNLLTLKWQGTVGEVQPGTIDGIPWYSRRFEQESTSHTFTPHPGMRWLARRFPDGFHFGSDDVTAILDAFAAGRIPQLAYSCHLSAMVHAADWERAESHRPYADMGVSDCPGGSIHAYAPADASEMQIVAAIGTAMKASPYVSDDTFARWVTAGRQWMRINSTANPGHRPLTREQILGRPIPAGMSAELPAIAA